MYETKDGKWMTVGALEPQFYSLMIDLLDFSKDERSSLPHQMDMNQWETLRSIFSRKFKEKTQAEWSGVRRESSKCCSESPHLLAFADFPVYGCLCATSVRER